jgi:hypothetical protein
LHFIARFGRKFRHQPVKPNPAFEYNLWCTRQFSANGENAPQHNASKPINQIFNYEPREGEINLGLAK